MVRDAIYAAAGERQVDFILSLGDYVVDGRYPSHWKKFFQENNVESPILSEIPYFPVAGSHEWTNDETIGLKNYQAVFGCPRFYSIESSDLDIYVIDSNMILDPKGLIDNQTQAALFDQWIASPENSNRSAWLESALDRAEGAEWIGVVAGYYDLQPGKMTSLFQIPYYVEKVGFIKQKKVAKINKIYAHILFGRFGIEEVEVQ